MGVISEVLGETNAVLSSYPETVFNAVGPALQTVLATAGTLSLMFAATNVILQFRPMSVSTYAIWALRFACIVAFATVWSNFKLAYDAIVELPTQYSTYLIPEITTSEKVVTWERLNDSDRIKCFITAKIKDKYKCDNPREVVSWVSVSTPIVRDANDVYSKIDDFREKMFSTAKTIIDKFSGLKGSTYKYLLGGFFAYIIAIIFTATSVVILMVSKVGLAATMGLAPLAIAMLTFNATRGYFESWLRLAVGFAIVPMMLVAIMGVVITVANKVANDGDDLFGGQMPFFIVCVAGLVLLFQIPTMASSLASISLPAMGPAMAANAMSRIGQVATAPTRALNAAESRVRAGIAGAQASSAGGSNKAVAGLMGMRSMLQSSQYRANRFGENSRNQLTIADGKAAGNLRSPLGAPQKSG